MLRTACAALLVLVLAGCTQAGGKDGTSSKAERTPPRLGACRALVPDDITPVTGSYYNKTRVASKMDAALELVKCDE